MPSDADHPGAGPRRSAQVEGRLSSVDAAMMAQDGACRTEEKRIYARQTANPHSIASRPSGRNGQLANGEPIIWALTTKRFADHLCG